MIAAHCQVGGWQEAQGLEIQSLLDGIFHKKPIFNRFPTHRDYVPYYLPICVFFLRAWNVLSLGAFYIWDILYLGRFVVGIRNCTVHRAKNMYMHVPNHRRVVYF
jgi:hypothetical protein